jgi:uncharacterized protein with PQ loop repeat
MYNVTLRHVRKPLLQWKNSNYGIFWACVCGVRYRACSAHRPYCHVACPAIQYFFHVISQMHEILKQKKVSEYTRKMLVLLSLQLWNISGIKKYWARYNQKRILVFLQSTRYSCRIVMKLKFSRHIFEKYSNIKFYENPSSGSRVVPCG